MNILNTLAKEKELLLEMLNTLKREKEVLIKDDVKALESIVKEKEELKYRIDEVENIRISLCGNKKLKDVLLELKGEEKKEAGELGEDIEKIVFGIREVNDTNNLLIKQSLNYIRAVINAIAPVKPSVYKPTGRIEQGNAESSILNKSV